MIASLRCDCAFFLEEPEIIKCRWWRPECVARQQITETMDWLPDLRLKVQEVLSIQ